MSSRSGKTIDHQSNKTRKKKKSDKASSSSSHVSGYLSDWSQTADNELNDGSLTISSRLSPNSVCDMLDTFCDYKRWLVAETGFGGTLVITRQKKLNLKLSSWLLRNVNIGRREIVIGKTGAVPFWDADVHKVLGVPNGPREIRAEKELINPAGVDFIKNALGMDSNDNAHRLKAAEKFLRKEISSTSSKLEKDCFKIAYVIFVMGHFLAPGTKHDYSTIDFWNALEDADNIQQYNWCGYILEEILKAASKLQHEIASKSTTAHLAGCHFFLQVCIEKYIRIFLSLLNYFQLSLF
jgi:hypothetical protein